MVHASRWLPPAVLRTTSPDTPFRSVRNDPSPTASGVVHHTWAVAWSLPDGVEHEQPVVTYPCHHVTVEPDGCWAHGVVTARFTRTLRGSGRVVGAHLQVAGLAALSAHDDLAFTKDRQLPLGDVLDLSAADEEALSAVARAASPDEATGLLDEWLGTLPRHEVPHADLVEQAVSLAADEQSLVRVEDLADRLAVSPRTLQRHLGRVLGVTPRWLLRRARIHDALEAVDAGGVEDWAGLAHRLGFADQAHFTNAFTQIVGVPPARYARRPSPLPDG